MTAPLLNCHNCGAPAPSDAAECAHCKTVLASVACPECMGLMFNGTRFCPHCGAAAQRTEHGPSGDPCPGCETELHKLTVGSHAVSECPNCHGVWMETQTLKNLSMEAEKGTLPDEPILQTFHEPRPPEEKVRYKKCPSCLQFMHRSNFANRSGVIVDSCHRHGTWFEEGELQRVIYFIKNGGLSAERERERQEIAEDRRRLEVEVAQARAERTSRSY